MAGGWVFVRHCVDEGKGGAKVEGRGDFKRMMQDAARGQCDVVVPFDATRLARDGVDIVSMAKQAKLGIFVYRHVDYLQATIRARLHLRNPTFVVDEDDVARLVGKPDGEDDELIEGRPFSEVTGIPT